MPTSARKVRGLSGWSVRVILPFPPLGPRGDVGIAPYARGEALTIHPSGILEFLFVFVVDFFELSVYNKVNKNQLRRNLT